MIPDGPTDDYLRTQTHEGEDRGLSLESARREALLSAFGRMEQNWIVFMAVVTYLEEENIIIQPQAPPPPSQPALCRQCHGPIEDPFDFREVDFQLSRNMVELAELRRGQKRTRDSD